MNVDLPEDLEKNHGKFGDTSYYRELIIIILQNMFFLILILQNKITIGNFLKVKNRVKLKIIQNWIQRDKNK